MTLHPQAAAYLRELAARNPPSWTEIPPKEARELFRSLTGYFGQTEPVPEVRDLSLEGGLRLRVYYPHASQRLPVVLYFHGGGWLVGDCDTHDSLCRRLANQSSCCVVSVDYRLAPEHKYPLPLQDAYEALEYVVQHAGHLHVDADRIGVAGDSAGGNMATALCLMSRRLGGPRIACQLLIYPVIAPDFDTATYREFAEGYGLTREAMMYFWRCYLASPDQACEPEVCPLRAPSLAGLPPAHVMTAEYDVLRDEAEAYAQQLTDAGVPTRLTRYDGMLHGFVHNATLFDDGRRARDDAARFLFQVLHDSTS